MPDAPSEQQLTYQESAALLKCSVETIRRRVKSGDLPAYRYGPRVVRIKKHDLEKLAQPVRSEESLEEHIAKVVAAAPPLTPEQRDKLAMLFRASGGAAA